MGLPKFTKVTATIATTAASLNVVRLDWGVRFGVHVAASLDAERGILQMQSDWGGNNSWFVNTSCVKYNEFEPVL